MNNEKPLFWFKRRRYGWGWTPITWQGWATVIVLLAIIIGGAIIAIINTPDNTFSLALGIYLAVVFLSILGLILIARKKGPTPKWRWGKTESDDPDQDF